MFGSKRKRLKTLSDEEARKKLEDLDLEKGDATAMFIAAFITFIPAILLLLGGLWFIVWVLFLR